MSSFDIVSEVNMHELCNAVDQANREISNRFDFKGTGAVIEQRETQLILHAPGEFQLKQMMDILAQKLTKRGLDLDCLEEGEVEISGRKAKQVITVRRADQGY